MSILQSLKVVSAVKRVRHSPIQHRRNNLIARIQEQINAANARQGGRAYTVKSRRRIKNRETGEVREIDWERRIKESWWVGDDGHVYLELRYGVKPLEFAKGKNAIDVGKMNELIPTLEALKKAAEEGEFDDQLKVVADRFDKQLVGARKKVG